MGGVIWKLFSTMAFNRSGLQIGIAVLALIAGWFWSERKADEAIRDFVREATLAQAEKAFADKETKAEITKDIDNASIDDLRARAAAGGMFTDSPDP